MKNKCKVITIANQKGGVGKTATSISLGVSLAKDNHKVLLIDFDPQGNLTKGLGYRDSNSYKCSIKDALLNEVNDIEIIPEDYVIHTNENVDLILSNILLSDVDMQLFSVMNRETVLKRVLEKFKDNYDYVLIDSNPTLGLFTINGLSAADSIIIIPVQARV